MDLKDCLEELEFQRDENPDVEVVKKRWKDLCKKHHPDKEGGNEEKFKSVTHAYKMLTDTAYRTKHKPLRGEDLNLTVQFPLSFEEAYAGTTRVFSYAVTDIGEDGFPAEKKQGEPLEIETLTLKIPPGSFADDFHLKFPGKGFRKGSERGSTIFVPQRRPHAQFSVRQGRILGWGYAPTSWDIYSKVSLPLHEFLTGKKVRVLTMRGLRKIRVPPGTLPGQEIRIGGLGCSGGDHVVVVDVKYPDERELKTDKWKGLGIAWEEDFTDEEEEELLSAYKELSEGDDDGI